MICAKEQKVQGRREMPLKSSSFFFFFYVKETGFIFGSF